MVPFALAVVVLYGLFTGLVGARLLLLWKRTRALPEATLGVSYVVGGMLGWAALLFGGGIVDRAPTLSFWLNAIGLFCFSAGTSSLALFCWRVFAPASRWQRALFFALVGTLVVDFVHNIVLVGVPFPPPASFWYWPGMLARTAIIGWRPIATLSYYARMRRRLALGLADPVAADRVFLWGVAGALTGVMTCIIVAVTLAGLWSTPAGPPFAVATVVSATIDSALSWLAFVPPRGYVAWVKARTARVEG